MHHLNSLQDTVQLANTSSNTTSSTDTGSTSNILVRRHVACRQVSGTNRATNNSSSLTTIISSNSDSKRDQHVLLRHILQWLRQLGGGGSDKDLLQRLTGVFASASKQSSCNTNT